MASRKIDASKVVWIDDGGRAALAAQLAGVGDPAEALDILNSRSSATGQYREQLGDALVDGPQGTTVLAPQYGDLVVWVDDAPDDREDGAGHFERYNGDEADYKPQRSA